MIRLPKLPNNECIKTCDEDRGGFKKKSKSRQNVEEEISQSFISKFEEDTYKHVDQASKSVAKDILISKEKFEGYGVDKIKPGIENVNSSRLKDLTATRPTVSKYSLDRYSYNEWKEHNKRALDNNVVTESNSVDYNAQTDIMTAIGKVDKVQRGNERMLKQRAKEIFRWKVEAEAACKAMAKEVEIFEIEKQRFINASRALILAESIIKECIDVRSNRNALELVADRPEQELLKEKEMVKQIRETINTSVQKLEEQLAIDKAAKHRIEYDWCDKSVAHNTDSENLALNYNNNTIMFKYGSVRYSDNTAPLEYYDFYCRENIKNVEATRQHSVNFRSSLNVILTTKSKELRKQADKTDKMLANTVALTTELLTKLEENFRYTLQSLADTEKLIQNLRETVLKMDRAMKLSQTRLDNRNNWRPHDENVKDETHLGLFQGVKIIHETTTSLLMQLKKAEKVRTNLIEKRLEIVNDIAAKKKTLDIDKLRCGMIRSHYPTGSQLAGL